MPRYGVIHGKGEPELQPLEKHTDEDEEDIALFDVKDSKWPKWNAETCAARIVLLLVIE